MNMDRQVVMAMPWDIFAINFPTDRFPGQYISRLSESNSSHDGKVSIDMYIYNNLIKKYTGL